MAAPAKKDTSVQVGLAFVVAFVLLCAFLASGHRSVTSGYDNTDPGVCSRSAPDNC